MAQLPKTAIYRLGSNEPLGDHPDSNLINGFLEQALSAAERAKLMQHFARCSDCRELLTLSAPETCEAIPVRAPSQNWLSWPVLRWGAAVACVLVVGAAVSVRYRSHNRESIPPEAVVSQAKPERLPAAPVQMKSNLPELRDDKALDAEAARSALRYQRPTRSEVPAPANAQMASNQAFAGRINQTNEAELKAAPGPAPETTVAENAPSASAAQLDTVPGRAKDAGAVPAATGSGAALHAPAASARALALNAVSPAFAKKVAPRWTLGSDGTLQRSFDSGNTWENVPIASQARFRALAANGMDIWVGGTNGALYHSIDAGRRWMQVQPSVNGQPLTADIIGVEFTDPQHGTLTTSANETWGTADGGQSWSKN